MEDGSIQEFLTLQGSESNAHLGETKLWILDLLFPQASNSRSSLVAPGSGAEHGCTSAATTRANSHPVPRWPFCLSLGTAFRTSQEIVTLCYKTGFVWGYPGGSDGRVCRPCRRPGFYPWVGEMLWRGEWLCVKWLCPTEGSWKCSEHV